MKGESFLDDTFDRIFMRSDSWMVCTYIENENESKMREYLLYPERRWGLVGGQYFLVRNLESLWPFFIDRQFLCIHLFFDNQLMVRNPELRNFNKQEMQMIIERSNLQVGIGFKKSLSGRKAFLRQLGDFVVAKDKDEGEDEEGGGVAKKDTAKPKKPKKIPAPKPPQAPKAKKVVPKREAPALRYPAVKYKKRRFQLVLRYVQRQLQEDATLRALSCYEDVYQCLENHVKQYLKKCVTEAAHYDAAREAARECVDSGDEALSARRLARGSEPKMETEPVLDGATRTKIEEPATEDAAGLLQPKLEEEVVE